LRVSEATGLKGPVHSEKPAEENSYNQNFQNRFCGCEQDYDVQKEKGTMFQCLGLATIEEGGCGEDWWHPECLVGLPRDWHKKLTEDKAAAVEESKPEIQAEDSRQDVTENGVEAQAPDSHDAILEDFSLLDEDDPLPPGFPQEDDFEQLICYKCLDAFPWIKRYAGSTGFLPPVFRNVEAAQPEAAQPEANTAQQPAGPGAGEAKLADLNESKKRKASPDADVTTSDSSVKRQRSSATPPVAARNCRYEALPPAATGTFTICFNEGFRDQLCKCMSCFPILKDHPYLLEEEALYQPPISSDSDDEAPGSLGSRSLLDRGEAALSNVDRVRAIEGVMVYNHLKDKVKDFLKPFADSKTPVGAEDIKRYFEGLRGDAEAIRTAAAKSSASGNDDNRREQSGKAR
jgi:E3 ubiquitin-protein ligase UBR7